MHRLTRRTFLLTGAAAICAACEHMPVLSSAQRSIDLVLYGLPDVPVDREAIENLPYATTRAKLGRSGWIVMVLGRYEGDFLHWVSADKITVVTQGGRVVRTAGLPENLVGTNFTRGDPLTRIGGLVAENAASNRTIDLRPQNLFGIPVQAFLVIEGTRQIEIAGRRHNTIQLSEFASVELLDWEFKNLFWIDSETGFVWKSVQHVSPGLPPIEMEILKPAA